MSTRRHPQNIAERAIHDKFQGGDQQLTEWQVSELSLYSLPAPAPTPGPPPMSFNFKTTHHRQVFRLNINVCLSNMKNDELVTQQMLLCYCYRRSIKRDLLITDLVSCKSKINELYQERCLEAWCIYVCNKIEREGD